MYSIRLRSCSGKVSDWLPLLPHGRLRRDGEPEWAFGRVRCGGERAGRRTVRLRYWRCRAALSCVRPGRACAWPARCGPASASGRPTRQSCLDSLARMCGACDSLAYMDSPAFRVLSHGAVGLEHRACAQPRPSPGQLHLSHVECEAVPLGGAGCVRQKGRSTGGGSASHGRRMEPEACAVGSVVVVARPA